MGGSTRYLSPTEARCGSTTPARLVHSAPAAAGGYVYLGNDAGEVHVVDRATGEPVQIIHAGVPVSGQLVVTERALFVTSGEAGTLIALR